MEPEFALIRFEGMKRIHLLLLLIPLIAFVIGILLTDITPLHYNDWKWRYTVRIALAGIATLVTILAAWRHSPRFRIGALVLTFIPLFFIIPYAHDLYNGPGRIYGITYPNESTGEMREYEQEWLPQTDRILE